MKKILMSLCCAGLVLASCTENPAETQTMFNFSADTYQLTDEGDLTVTVTATKAVTEAVDIRFTASGTAEEGTDYTVSADHFAFSAGETEASITLSSVSVNKEDLDLTLTLSDPGVEGYALGTVSSAKITVPAKETVYYSFVQTNLDMESEMEIVLNLVTTSAGADYRTPAEFRLPFTITTDAVAGTDYRVKDNATEFIFAEGTNSASIVLESLLPDTPDVSYNISISINADEIDPSYKDYFGEGAYPIFEVDLTNPRFTDYIGRWAYSGFPILDDPEADRATLEMITLDAGDDLNDLPHDNTSDDVIEFREENGGIAMVTSLSGDLKNYFMDCEISDITATTYEWYFYYPARPLNAVSATLSAVNYNFSAASVQEQSASVFFAVTSGSDGRQLHVFVRDYQPTDFFQGTYAYGEHLVWDMYKEFGYWDLYFVFNEVNE